VEAALRRADAVFAPSSFTARRVEAVAGLAAGSVHVIPHALPPVPEVDRVAAHGRPRVLTVARLTRENRYKGVDMLLYAWPRVLSEVDAELLVVGEGPDADRLRSIARLLGVEDSVMFTGRLSDDDLAAAYASASVFAMPARHRLEPRPEGEGFGLVYAEAGARGLPVVASAGGGVDDVVRDRVNGLLVDPEDAADVARGIVTLLTDEALAARLGEEGRRFATTELAPERFRERIEALIRDDLRPRGLVT
jgi:phosphatidylinositol alpha-1,6-mannosyltransferase